MRSLPELLRYKRFHPLIAILAVSLVALLCAPLMETENYHAVPFILLFVVTILATFMGIVPVLIAATLGALVWNYFFIPPHFTFHIEKTEDILLFAMFFMIAMLNGVLTSRLQEQEQLARDREKHAHALLKLTRELAEARGQKEMMAVAERGIKREFGLVAEVIVSDGATGSDIPRGAHKSDIFPLTGISMNPGYVVLKNSRDFEEDVFWSTYLTQISGALEREYLGELAQKARFLDESDRLYKALFNSISHELRIPVATVMGAAESMLTQNHTPGVQRELAQEIFTASARLNRVIENLLNISRLESGRISPHLDWHDMHDLVNKVLADLEEELRSFVVTVNIPEEMPPVYIDFGLMEQVLYNLLFNSAEHAPARSEIGISLSHEHKMLQIIMHDSGPGFPKDKIGQVFDKFFRIEHSRPGGLGLGLSIVKGFVEAHRGSIMVENRPEGGAMFTMLIPCVPPEKASLKS